MARRRRGLQKRKSSKRRTPGPGLPAGPPGAEDPDEPLSAIVARRAKAQAQIDGWVHKADARLAASERRVVASESAARARDQALARTDDGLRRLRRAWSRWLTDCRHRVAIGIQRMAIWLRVRSRARRSRRRREALAYLARAHHEQLQRERASSAMLAVLTERVARAGASDASARELDDTVAHAERIITEYDAQRHQIESVLERARAKTQRWVHWHAVAQAKGSPELATQARAYLDDCERDEADLVRAVEDCYAGCRRLRDAIEQLQALGRRSVP